MDENLFEYIKKQIDKLMDDVTKDMPLNLNGGREMADISRHIVDARESTKQRLIELLEELAYLEYKISYDKAKLEAKAKEKTFNYSLDSGEKY